MIHNPNMSNHMKALAILTKIKENLCYHVGHHSFVSLITLEAGVPIKTISKILGHSNIQTIQVYTRVTSKKLFENMDRLIETTKDFKFVFLLLWGLCLSVLQELSRLMCYPVKAE